VDPIIHPGQSPYSYCYNNPVNYIDPSGMAAGSGGGGFNDPGWQGKPFPLITSGMWDESRGGTYCIDWVEVPAYMALILIRSNAVDWDKSWVGSRVPGHWKRVLAGYSKVEVGPKGTLWDESGNFAGYVNLGGGESSFEPYYEWAWVPDDGLSRELTPEDELTYAYRGPRSHFSASFSGSFLTKGYSTTVNGQEERYFTSATLLGGSFDLSFGPQPLPTERWSEIPIGLGKYLGIGIGILVTGQVNINLHLGFGASLPFYFVVYDGAHTYTVYPK